MNFNNKFQKDLFKVSSRNQASLLSSRSPKFRNKGSKKLVILSTKMIAQKGKKTLKQAKLGGKYHSLDSGGKVPTDILIVSNIIQKFASKQHTIISKKRRNKGIETCNDNKENIAVKDVKLNGNNKICPIITMQIQERMTLQS